MSEPQITAISTGILSVGCLIVAALFFILLRVMSKNGTPTRLAKSMERKYAAMTLFFGVMGILNFYTSYYSHTGSVGIFTFHVRTFLRWSAAAAIAVLIFSLVVMIIQYLKARRKLRKKSPA